MQKPFVLIVASTAAALALAAPAFARVQTPPPAQQKPAVTVPEAELTAAKAIAASPDAAGQVQLAAAFMQKYPKSALTHQIAIGLAAKIDGLADPVQRLALSQAFRKSFPDAAEADLILPIVVDANLKLNKIDEALKEANDFLSRHPNDLASITQVAIVGVEAAKHGNPKFMADSEKNALKAIAMIEGDQKPATFADAQWAEYKTKWLGLLYQGLGVGSLMAGKTDEASARLTKSAALSANDPTTYYLLGTIINGDVQKMNERYNAAAAGPAKDEALKAELDALDRMIDLFAHAVGLSEGDAGFKNMHDMALEDLTKFYTFRHKNTDGMQALIDKYKKAPGKF